MKTQIKAFYAAHKTAIIICTVVLVIAANAGSFKQGYNSSYNNQGSYGQGMNGQRQQNQQSSGFFSRMFGGSNEAQQGNYNRGNAGYTNNGGGYAGNNGNTGGYAGTNNNADIISGYERQQASNDASAERFDDYIRDQGNYEDGNGNTYKMSSQYSNNYVNETTGEAVQSNDPSYNPGGNYTAVTPSDYSASAAPAAATTTESGE